MKRFIEDLNTTEFDVVVIGGGITGAAVAYDAASRGLSVALAEKNDFGCATSAATSKLIHGGFRYLANLEFGIVRESLKERRTLENIAPNLVYPMRVMVPCYKQGITKHTWAVRLGMMLYDSLSFDKGRTWDKSKSIGFHKAVPAMKALEMEPSIPRKGFKKAFSYYLCPWFKIHQSYISAFYINPDQFVDTVKIKRCINCIGAFSRGKNAEHQSMVFFA